MLETIFTRKDVLLRHQTAPLLHEREEHLQRFRTTNHSRQAIVTRANYLLAIVERLGLTDATHEPVGIEAVQSAARKYSIDKIGSRKRRRGIYSRKRFEIIATNWLGELGRLDRRDSEGSIFNDLYRARQDRVRVLAHPLFDERRRYLEKLKGEGYCRDTLIMTSEYMIHVIDHMGIDGLRKVARKEIECAARAWQERPMGRFQKQRTLGKSRFISFVRVATRWLDFLGLIEKEDETGPLHQEMSKYIDWMSRDRGLSPQTSRYRRSFLRELAVFLSERKVRLAEVSIGTIDDFFVFKAKSCDCSRRSIALYASVLRDFFRFAKTQGWCRHDLSVGIRAPRLYADENLPSYLPWHVVGRMLVKSSADTSAGGIRAHAILTLLCVYGMRCSELTGLTVDDIDWRKETLILRRAKCGRQQVMPLVKAAGDAIIRYVRDARRNPNGHRTLFLGLSAPYAPLRPTAVHHVVSNFLRAENVPLAHYGPHCLRHTCATRLVNSGHSLKEVSDILGHRRIDTTRIYAKVDLMSLREVSETNWGDVL